MTLTRETLNTLTRFDTTDNLQRNLAVRRVAAESRLLRSSNQAYFPDRARAARCSAAIVCRWASATRDDILGKEREIRLGGNAWHRALAKKKGIKAMK